MDKFNSICLLSHAPGKAELLSLHSYLVISWFIRRSQALLQPYVADHMHYLQQVKSGWTVSMEAYNIHKAWGFMKNGVCIYMCDLQALPAAVSHPESLWGAVGSLSMRFKPPVLGILHFYGLTSVFLSSQNNPQRPTSLFFSVQGNFMPVLGHFAFFKPWLFWRKCWRVFLRGGEQLHQVLLPLCPVRLHHWLSIT